MCKIGVDDLRSRLTLIPQDPALFAGSLRHNVDPFGEHSDEECLDALRRVHLIGSGDTPPEEVVPSQTKQLAEVDSKLEVPSGRSALTLDTEIASGGLSLSNGQRQLVAMARALLKSSAVVVMDEATSNIDHATDTKIQMTIREQFSNCTLIVIALRAGHFDLGYGRCQHRGRPDEAPSG